MNLAAILGAAGTGKTTKLRERSEDSPNFARITATTGIAAVNLGPGVTTVHSALGFYNAESAWEAYQLGKLAKRFVSIAKQGYENLVIDEVSMMTDQLLDILVQAARDAEDLIMSRDAGDGRVITPCGLILTGDFLQLPPVRGEFCFHARNWQDFSIERLTTIYRQVDPVFLEALDAARRGQGVRTVQKLQAAGVTFVAERNNFFEGTTIVPTNVMADCINRDRFAALDTEIVGYKSARWGVEAKEWDNIPEVLDLREGAIVMVLANEPQTFTYVNGDTGVVRSFDEASIEVEITRSDGKPFSAVIPYVARETLQKEQPVEAEDYLGFCIGGNWFKRPSDIADWKTAQKEGLDENPFSDEICEDIDRTGRQWYAKFFEAHASYVIDACQRHLPYFSVDKDRWVVGWISYMPLRCAWATTVHKAQGLTMDNVQIDARNRFAGNPAMMYVALSRCRNPQTIRIVASPADFARRVKTASEVMRWA